MTLARPGYDKVVLTALDDGRLCNSVACARAGTLAEVIVTYGVLDDLGASLHSRAALRHEQWGMSYPLCGVCWEQSAKSRPGPARPGRRRHHPRPPGPRRPQPSGGRASPQAFHGGSR